MPSLGLTDRPEAFEWWEGTRNQMANPLTFGERARIVTLGAWIRGVSGYGSVSYRLCVWNPDGTVRRQTAVESIGTAAVNVSNLTRVEHDLTETLDVDDGEVVWVGIARSISSALQTGWHDHGSAGSHREKTTSSWPVSMDGATTHGSTGALGMYVASYQAIGAAHVRRSGTMIEAEQVRTRRSGSWVEPSSVQIRRSGAWNDAE